MLDFKEININDKELFDKYLKKFDLKASELTFTNLFIWRHSYKFQYSNINNYLCIISNTENDAFAFIPIGSYDKSTFIETICILNDYFKSINKKFYLKRVCENQLDYIRSIKISHSIEFDRDNSDYIYLANDLSYLKGRKFTQKRNHINKFKTLYKYEYNEINDKNISYCYNILKTWCSNRNPILRDVSSIEKEKQASEEILNNFFILKCRGAIIKVDNSYEAFVVGEKKNDTTGVVHIEKANYEIHGLYAFINQQFSEKGLSDVLYINREQDLGLEGLRKAKLSYNPNSMINKYTVIF